MSRPTLHRSKSHASPAHLLLPLSDAQANIQAINKASTITGYNVGLAYDRFDSSKPGNDIMNRKGGGPVRWDGLANADDLMAKANLALHIHRTIEARKLTQAQAASLLGIDQPKVSSIINGRLDGFSTD